MGPLEKGGRGIPIISQEQEMLHKGNREAKKSPSEVAMKLRYKLTVLSPRKAPKPCTSVKVRKQLQCLCFTARRGSGGQRDC